MKAKKRTKGAPSPRQTLERWTVDRLDEDAGMARIEAVPIRPEKLTDELLDTLSEKGLEIGLDDLTLWDANRARIERVRVNQLETKLNLRSGEKKTLSENMVFWVVRPVGAEKKEHVYHATRAARKIAKDYYQKVYRREGGKP
ncbi:MAG: hypothetical protein P8181_05470 [bacterium]